MTIKYITGDVVTAFENKEFDVLIHGCNACGVMGSGIALQIKNKYPEAYGTYKEHEKLYGLSLGGYSIHACGEGRRIVNLITQDKYLPRDQRHFSYDHFVDAIKSLANIYQEKKVAMPKIGAGLGGGDWKIIEAIINSAFGDREVYVYTLEKPKTDGRNDIG